MTDRTCQTLQCHCCDERKPRTGFRVLAKHIPICPVCFPQIEPYLSNLNDFRHRVFEQSVKLAINLIRLTKASGAEPPEPELLVEKIEELTTV